VVMSLCLGWSGLWVVGQFEFFPIVSRIKKIQTDVITTTASQGRE
jgi:hypothetical protein